MSARDDNDRRKAGEPLDASAGTIVGAEVLPKERARAELEGAVLEALEAATFDHGADFRPTVALAELTARAARRMDAAGLTAAPARPPLRTIGDELRNALGLARRRASGEERPALTPWPDFNAQVGGGLWPGLHMLVGGTGAGKSTFTLQAALEAATGGAAVAYVGLELDPAQVALRIGGARAGVSWSALYTGKASEAEIASVADAAASLPPSFYLESASAGQWSAADLRVLAARMRELHPDTSLPIVIVVDYLQVLGAEPGSHARQELRERIGKASYAARAAAVDHGAVVLLVSSVAREHYAKVGGEKPLSEAGLCEEKDGGGFRHAVRFPDTIVGLGKESGEIEFAADTVTVLARWPGSAPDLSPAVLTQRRAMGEPLPPRSRVVLASAKVRAGVASWCELRTTGTHFTTSPDGGASIAAELRASAPANGGPRSGTKPGGIS